MLGANTSIHPPWKIAVFILKPIGRCGRFDADDIDNANMPRTAVNAFPLPQVSWRFSRTRNNRPDLYRPRTNKGCKESRPVLQVPTAADAQAPISALFCPCFGKQRLRPAELCGRPKTGGK